MVVEGNNADAEQARVVLDAVERTPADGAWPELTQALAVPEFTTSGRIDE